MKYLIYIGGLGLLLALAGCQPKEDNRNSLLWKVSGNGLEEPSYLYGVWHFMCEDEFYLPEKVLPALYSTKSYVTELNMYGGYPHPDTVGNNDLISQLDSQLVQDIKRIMLPEWAEWGAYYQKARPLDLAMGVSSFSISCYPDIIYYEDSLLKLIAKKDMGWSYLEKTDSYFESYSGIPNDQQMEILQYVVNNFSTLKEDVFANWYDIYHAEQIDSMHTIVTFGYDYLHPDSENPGLDSVMLNLSQAILDSRNETWLPKMQEMMQQKPTFFAVGAAHLGGDMGLVNMLQREGYAVEPVH